MDQLVSLPQCILVSIIVTVLIILILSYVMPCSCCSKTTEPMLGYKTGTPNDNVLSAVLKGY